MEIIQKERGTISNANVGWKELVKQLKINSFSKIFILTDSNTKIDCLPYFLSKVNFKQQPELLEMRSGEQNKNISTCIELWTTLSEKGADRNSLLINLGGGVVTDLGGFIASTYRRGIEFINIPTTLLAMVDASVGGKNGIDLGDLKNQIGIIRNPLLVLIDIEFLKTLPQAELTSGYAEMLKHGLIYSEEYWNELKQFSAANMNEVNQLIWASVKIKNEVVTEDPLEKGRRKTLNYGHTLGHAIESYCLSSEEKKTLLHGEAIAIGMILATYISNILCNFPKQKLEAVTSTFLKHFQKEFFTKKDIESIIDLLKYDKKNSHGAINFVLLENFGKHRVNCHVENQLIYEAFNYYDNY